MVTIIGKGDDGKNYTVTIAETAVAPPVPPAWLLPNYPADFNALQISPTISIPIDGVNTARAANQAIIYTLPSEYAKVNTWGVDIVINGATGKAVMYRDREKCVITSHITGAPHVVDNEYVISAHGTKADLLRNFVGNLPSAPVFTLVKSDVPVPPVNPPATPGKAWITTWGMIFPDSPKVDFGKLPLEIDELSLAFIFRNGVISGYSQYGLNALKAQLQAFYAAKPGRIVSGSLGGGGYDLDVSDVPGFVRNLKFIEQQLGISWGGLNCDLEAKSFVASAPNLFKIYRQFMAERPGFVGSWSPNGTYVDAYINVLKDNLDVLKDGWIAQQFYDSPVSAGDAAGRIQQMLDAKIPIGNIGIGMMLEDGNPNRWTLQQSIDNTKTLVAHFNGLTHVDNWEASRPKLKEWATAMKGIIG